MKTISEQLKHYLKFRNSGDKQWEDAWENDLFKENNIDYIFLSIRLSGLLDEVIKMSPELFNES